MRSQLGQTAPTSQPAPVQATAAQTKPATAPALPQNAASGPTSPVKPSGRGKVPPAAIGFLAGGGALTLAIGGGVALGGGLRVGDRLKLQTVAKARPALESASSRAIRHGPAPAAASSSTDIEGPL